LDFIDALRRNSIEIPICVLTEYSSPDLFVRLKERRIEDVLIKPFNSGELVNRVSSMLTRQSEIV